MTNTPKSNNPSFEEKVREVVDRYTNWLKCDEYHIHSDDPEFADGRDWDEDNHQNFDDDQAVEAISKLVEEEVKRARIDEL